MTRTANWVDRNEPAEGKIARCLAVYLGRKPTTAPAEFGADAAALLHMVAANGSEVQVASYLRTVEQRVGFDLGDGRVRRTLAIAIWHIAKAGLVRDRLVSFAAQYGPPATAERVPLSAWLSEILLRDGEVPPVSEAVPPSTASKPGRSRPRKR